MTQADEDWLQEGKEAVSSGLVEPIEVVELPEDAEPIPADMSDLVAAATNTFRVELPKGIDQYLMQRILKHRPAHIREDDQEAYKIRAV